MLYCDRGVEYRPENLVPRHGNVDGAISAFEKAVEMNSSDLDTQNKLAVAYFDERMNSLGRENSESYNRTFLKFVLVVLLLSSLAKNRPSATTSTSMILWNLAVDVGSVSQPRYSCDVAPLEGA